MHHRAVARERRGLDDLVVPVDGEFLVFLVDQDFKEGQQVLGIERRGRGREPSRDIGEADDLDAVARQGRDRATLCQQLSSDRAASSSDES